MPMMALPTLLCLSVAAVDPAELMPRPGDYTLMWWADGFPAHTPEAPWLRVIQTGHYAFALETDTLKVPHFGALATGLDYAAAATADNSSWQALPPAELSLKVTVDGRDYRCTKGGRWTQFDGPRLIDSGRFVQRADVTNLEFQAADGTPLNVDARFETIAWPDRLAVLLAARPGLQSIPAGEPCFGRLGGGFGCDGTNHLNLPNTPEPEQLTLEFWAFVPTDWRAGTKTYPWLVCANGNEWVDGNYGFALLNGRPRAFLNLGGGKDNCFSIDAEGRPGLQLEQWNHLALTYDGETMRVYLNGRPAGEQQIGRQRSPGKGWLSFGRRQDGSGDGYHFRGVLDEVRLYDQALGAAQIQARATHPEQTLDVVRPVASWSFDAAGQPSATRPSAQWHDASLEVALTTADGTQRQRWVQPAGNTWDNQTWHQTALVLTPGASSTTDAELTVKATELSTGADRPVQYEPAVGCYRVDLDGVQPVIPDGPLERQNDAMERVKLTLTNPTATDRTARLLFAKSRGGIKLRFGAPITGVSAFLRDASGDPTGIPVQLSKNWHNRPEGGVYGEQWFHGFSQVRLPADSTIELELDLVYGHYGGVAAASHAQLCLIGWGSNQLWEESALGAWGESICYEPDEAQARTTITDVRPLMVRSMSNNQEWSWTHNVGGGDFSRLFDAAGRRIFPARMKAVYRRQCPVLTEVVHAGRTGGIEHRTTVSLQRSDDLLRGIYRLQLEVKEPTDFSRFVFFQVGADSYNYTAERRMALGNEAGLTREWQTQWGGNTYRTEPLECTGRIPWLSLHEAVPRTNGRPGAWANRGIVIRSWHARLGGREAAPWAAEHGVKVGGTDTSTIDLVPPPGLTRLLPGDFVDAVVEHVIIPQSAADYYGPNEALRAALARDADTWRMIHREAVGNDRQVEVTVGTLEGLFPAVRIRAEGDRAEFSLTGGLGYVPLTITGLPSSAGPVLQRREPGGEWAAIDQSVHGNDYWQTDYDAATHSWEITYSVPSDSVADQPVRRAYRFALR